MTTMEQILDLARWAPSGDNTQVWQFEVINDHHVVVHGRFIGEHCVYDLQGHASELALGAMHETLTIAASSHGLETNITRRQGTAPNRPTFDVHLTPALHIAPSPLIPYITVRSVQRRALSTRPLPDINKKTLEDILPSGYRVIWLDGFRNRLRMALLMFHNAHIRLTIPEAYEEHRKVIQWQARFSQDRIPDQALGTDPLTTRVMQWAMASWKRISFLNRYLAGTWLARIEMDLTPGIACGAHFVIVADTPPSASHDYFTAGRAVQRFWLTATQLGLQLQPETTPLIFREYVTQGIAFSSVAQAQREATTLAQRFERIIGKQYADLAVFMGRIGTGKAAKARSLRHPLASLMKQAND